MKMLQRLLFFCLTSSCAVLAAAAEPAAPPNRGLVSFADLYRMTVSGAAPASLSFAEPTPEPQLRVAALDTPAFAEPRFSVAPAPGPGRWMLLLAGLAAFGWIAHRRLSRSL